MALTNIGAATNEIHHVVSLLYFEDLDLFEANSKIARLVAEIVALSAKDAYSEGWYAAHDHLGFRCE